MGISAFRKFDLSKDARDIGFETHLRALVYACTRGNTLERNCFGCTRSVGCSDLCLLRCVIVRHCFHEEQVSTLCAQQMTGLLP